jgi:ribokinase
MSVCVIGALNLDVICRVAELPKPGETVAGQSVLRLAGGKGANQAAASARCGAATTLIGAVGRDDAGRALLEALSGAGVDTRHVLQMADEATGHGFVWVSSAGENSIVVALGANMALKPEHLTAAAVEGHAVYLAQLECPVATIEAAFSLPAARRGLRILNGAPAELEGRRLFPLTDILIVNETELARFADLTAVPERAADIVAAARRLITRGDQTVIVTLGRDGAMAVTAADHFGVEGRRAKVMDTTGAGDCFCGVLSARLSDGAPLKEAMAWANAAAALSTERSGAVPAMPSRAEIAAALGA